MYLIIFDPLTFVLD